MARYTGPTSRLSRREGVDLGFKTVGSKSHASLLRRLNVTPGMHGQKGKRKTSNYGEQLREKQKLKRMYGVLERQFRKYFENARKERGNTGEKLLQFLETRLDNVVYRMALAPTRTSARQFVSHGHVIVDGQKVNIPSYGVSAGEVITMKPKALEIPAVKKMLELTDVKMPDWLERKGPAGKVVRLPERTDIVDDINEQLVVEFYSR